LQHGKSGPAEAVGAWVRAQDRGPDIVIRTRAGVVMLATQPAILCRRHSLADHVGLRVKLKQVGEPSR
jgi:hypothetical protein